MSSWAASASIEADELDTGSRERLTGFIYDGLPCRVVFGAGTLAQVGQEADRLGIKRAMVITTSEQRGHGNRLARMLGTRVAAICANATMHTPLSITERVMRDVERHDIDGLVALGGGSAIGLSKALSVRVGLPQLVLPTTYAGSEMTPILGETRDGIKTTRRSTDILPDTVIYDVELTLSLPAQMSCSSGMNAMAHAVEALYANQPNPITSLMAEEAIVALARALPLIARDPSDITARTDALYGAWLSGACLGVVGMSLHHKLCHVLGGTFNLPHAQTHAIVLPHATAYNAGAAPAAMARISRALNASDAPSGLYALLTSLGIPTSLAQLGMPESGIALATDLATRDAYANPRPVIRDGIRVLLGRAWRGDAPRS